MVEKSKYILIGLLGTIGSGKSTVSNYLVKKCGFYRIIMGDLVREKAKEEGLTSTRRNLQLIQKKYRDEFGQEYFIDEALKKLFDSGNKRLLVDGVRTPTDASVAKENGAKLIIIDSPPKLRYERLRARKREDDAQTFEIFKEQEEKEWELLKLKGGFKHADYRIENKGTINELLKKIDGLLKKLEK